MAVLHPEILYAQRSSATEEEKNIIYFTIQAPDIQGEPSLSIEPTKISFKAKAGDKAKGVPEKEYAFEIELYDEIVPELCKKSITSRAIVLILRKKAASAEFWPRLTKEKVKNLWIKTDFSKWVDEDEQEGAAGIDESEFSGAGGGPGGMPGGMGGMDMASMMGGMGGGMGGMGGMPGMGGMGGMPGMGGMGGMGGPGGMDFAKMMEQMGQGGAGGPGGFGDDSDDDLPDGGDDDEAAPAAPVAGETAPSGEAASEKLD